ncbi:MAG: hypothetical protein IJ086_13975 [Clostridium sp.]|nr:hypothetical protein [Clostridium sp.]MBQ9072680.1 hypothetical protein [Bacilli bacterium]
MELQFTREELENLRDVLKHEIKLVKDEIRQYEGNKAITKHLYNCIDSYELLDKKIYSYMRKH